MLYAKRWLGMALASASLWGCAASPKPVHSVAEYDLSCGRVEVTRIDDLHYAAAGCGRGAVYTQSCDDAGGCRWARMRHGHEIDVAANEQVPDLGPPPPRQIVPAPAPEERQVVPAPPPAEREIIPAPPPTSGGEAPAPSTTAPAASDEAQNQPVALAADELSEPYEAQVPERPLAQRVQYAPPVALEEAPPPAPQPTYVWVTGYWWSGNWGWTWVPGYWCPPRRGFVYLAGGWYWANNWWWYSPGGWGYPGSTVVVYAPSPRPQRVVAVRTIRPRPVSHGNSRGTVGVTAPSRTYRPTSSPLLPTRSRDAVAASDRSPGRLVRPNQGVPPRNSYGSGNTPSPGQYRPSNRDRFTGPSSVSPARGGNPRDERVLRQPSYPTRIQPSPSRSNAIRSMRPSPSPSRSYDVRSSSPPPSRSSNIRSVSPSRSSPPPSFRASPSSFRPSSGGASPVRPRR